MSENTLNKTYEPGEVERRWAGHWEKEGLTAASADSPKPPFSMVIPPPNITGALHVGHALNSTLQDVLARYKRMKGFNVLWLPGIDHAGIATQNVVERKLAAEGTDRHALGREEFLRRVWQWKEESGGTILKQLRRLGASCDWTRLRFTMDDGLSKAVREVFVRLYKEGLIYRGDYIINWCPRCHTALSDLEVQFEEKSGKLYYMEYPLKEASGGLKSLTVATTRPETMLGDTAVAVNPADERYARLIGRKLVLPLAGREIPIVGDDSVSVEFGTGAVKVTPAHDFNDFEISKRHGLPALPIMDRDARMNENAASFKGLDRFKARAGVLEGLEALGLLKKTEDYKIMLGSCYRCSTVVEPTLSKQWFVKTAPLAQAAVKAVEDGSIRFVPKNWENTYFDWMRNIRDWCISRQIWWGHRIPAWHCSSCGHVTVEIADPKGCAKCGGASIEQDPDVLDTWFSSALWPFSTLGWPEKTRELKLFYPTATLSTSFDIIFFWVARMIMMGLKFMDGKPPFRDVYIHALIRDAEGQKMSKSKGNVIDPLVMMDKHGTDAFRFTLAALAAQGRDIKLAEERVLGYRNFCNKLWNLARFTLMNVGDGFREEVEPNALNAADKWVLHRLSACVAEVERAIDAYEFDAAVRALYSFVWHELCDWYVEMSKKDLRGDSGPERKAAASSTLVRALKDSLKMLHPFMPFITEEIYSYLPGSKGSLLASPFPTPDEEAEGAGEAALMEGVMDVIRAVRNIRTEMNVPLDARVECLALNEDDAFRAFLKANSAQIKELARIGEISFPDSHPDRSVLSNAASAVAGGAPGGKPTTVYVPLKGVIDFEAEAKRLGKELEKTAAEFASIDGRLNNAGFVAKAPAEVVEKDRARRDALAEKKAKIETGLERLRGLAG